MIFGNIVLQYELLIYGTVCRRMSFQPTLYILLRIDKFWSEQELMYDYKADLTEIVNRSLISSIAKFGVQTRV